MENCGLSEWIFSHVLMKSFLLTIIMPHIAHCKGFYMEKSNGMPIFTETTAYYGMMDYAIFSVQLNFTEMNGNGRLLLSKVKIEFAWYKRINKNGNGTIAVFENLDSVVKTDHLMKFVETKIDHLRNNVALHCHYSE